jgi:hypothetical protein
MPYFFLNSSASGMLLPSGSPTSRASALILSRASCAASRTAWPMWNSEREPSVPMS